LDDRLDIDRARSIKLSVVLTCCAINETLSSRQKGEVNKTLS
jgi:hypothetical protein